MSLWVCFVWSSINVWQKGWIPLKKKSESKMQVPINLTKHQVVLLPRMSTHAPLAWEKYSSKEVFQRVWYSLQVIPLSGHNKDTRSRQGAVQDQERLQKEVSSSRMRAPCITLASLPATTPCRPSGLALVLMSYRKVRKLQPLGYQGHPHRRNWRWLPYWK